MGRQMNRQPDSDDPVESISAFGKRIGRAHSTVIEAIDTGRIPADCVVRNPDTGRRVGVYWRRALVAFASNTDPTQAERSGATPVMNTPPAARHPSIDSALQMFGLARQALDKGEFHKIESEMRQALRAVPEEQRLLVPIETQVMERLIAAVSAVVEAFQTEGSSERNAGGKEMSDAEADAVGLFWYAVAAGEIVVTPQMGDQS
jgi:hypothetical protein